MNKWHKGPPPSIGWWPASNCRNEHILRWWDGANWSDATVGSMNSTQAGKAARNSEWAQSRMEWTDRPESWPARSRT
jgi:hypothetical protein